MNQDQAKPPLRVGLVQFKPSKGDVRGNIDRIRAIIEQHAADVDLVAFPEACLSGYFLEGGVTEAAMSVEALTEWLGPPAANEPGVARGFYEGWGGGP